MSQEYIRKEAIQNAAVLLASGYDEKYVHEKLIKQGFSEDESKAILMRLTEDLKTRQANYQAQNYQAQNSEKSRQIIIGLVIMMIGGAITIFSYQAAASNPNGGTYVVAWGAIIFGGLRILQALAS